jgi:alpha-L-rhamnosidase
LLEGLATVGRADLALRILLTTTYPGFGYWIAQGATSLWETWEGERYKPLSSWNHVSNIWLICKHVIICAV